METMFVEAKAGIIKFPFEHINKLPDNVGLATTVQFIESIKDVKDKLEQSGKKVILVKGEHSRYPGQILGCDIPDIKVDAFLYIGTGKFHPQQLSMQKTVFVYNPVSDHFYRIDPKIAEKIKKRVKGAELKFYSSENIGVLISTKPGQKRIKQALKLKEKYPDKSFYFLLFDTLDFQLENFPFIECFVNTACPRISYDDMEKLPKPVLNISDLRQQ